MLCIHMYVLERFSISTHRVIVGTLVLGTIRTIAERFQATAILTAVRALAGMRTLMDF